MSHILAHPRVRNFFTSDYPDEFAERHPDYSEFSLWMPLQGSWSARVRHGVDPEPFDLLVGNRGVYLVGVFNDAPPAGRANPFDPAVVYIGRTRTATLGSRWTSFRRSAEGRGRPHSGGNQFHDDLVQMKPVPQAILSRTWIAGLPVWFDEAQPAISFRTALLESLLVDVVHHDRRARGLPDLLNKP